MLERLWSKGNTHPLLVKMQTCTTTLEINVVVSQETWSQPTSGSSNTTLVNISKRCSILLQSIYLTMFIAALFVVTETGNNLDVPFI